MRELELYLHIPFCERKCAYCDFLSFAAGKEIQKAYVDQLIQEIETSADRGTHRVSSVFFGGGTPSVLEDGEIPRILRAVRKAYELEEDAEISIECNPGTLSSDKLKDYREAGVNRISLGLQSAQEAELKSLGRIHTYEEFLESFLLARRAGFSNINVDLMSALPGQTLAGWEDNLQKTAALHPEHISAYSLIIEEGTPFFERYEEDAVRREAGEEPKLLPSEETERRMYERTLEFLKEKGYRRYEISNYAQPGFECRHNCGYWQRKEYRGFGLGAASLMGEQRWNNTLEMKSYLAGGWTERTGLQSLSRREQMEETMFLGLRMTEGIREEEFQKRFGENFWQVYGKTAERLIAQGLLERRAGRIRLTDRGVDVSNYVLSEFLF